MRFRYKDNRGKVTTLADVASLLKAIREGCITPDTPLAMGDDRNFQRADMVVAYQQAAVAVSRTGGTTGVAAPAVKAPWHVGTWARVGMGAAVAAGLVALAVWRIRAIDREHAAAFAAAPVGPGPVAKNAIAGIAIEFGDSAAVAQHRLAAWVERQRLPERFRGAALQAGASLRGVRSAAAKYRQGVDSLLIRTRDFAVMLVQRADSAEAADPGLNGLMAAVEDVLVQWQRDLTVYADIQRAAAATLDSLAAFVLERQQSFVIREGKPVFLSRQDAARFRELSDNLGMLAGREKAWADALKGRRPGWMTSLAEAERPRFGRNLLSGPTSN
jgi:hypothetical protein